VRPRSASRSPAHGARNLLLLAAALLSCTRLWRSTRDRAELTDGWEPGGSRTRVGDPSEAETVAYPIRPGIAFEQDLLDDLNAGPGLPASRSPVIGRSDRTHDRQPRRR